MIEIERKFLVTSAAYKKEAYKSYRIVQGFLNTHPERTVRVRLKDNMGMLTVKGKTSDHGLTRFEWEKEIDRDEALRLLELCEDVKIDKIRYLVQIENHTFEVDEFCNENEGLVIAEVELLTIDEDFIKPNWLGKEVTGQVKYYNSQLSKKPFNTWES